MAQKSPFYTTIRLWARDIYGLLVDEDESKILTFDSNYFYS